MKKQIYLFIVGMILLMIISVSAEKLNQPTELIQYCNNCSYCNISKIVYPNSTIFLTNLEMTKDGTAFNYTLISNYTNTIGEYCWGYDCGNIVESQTGKICFDVTNTGYSQSTAQSIGSFAYLILILFLTISLLFIGFKLTKSDILWVLGVFFLFLSFILLVYDVWLGYEYTINYTGSSSARIPETIFYIFIMIICLGLLVALILLFTKWKEIVKWFKGIFDKDESWDYDLGDDLKGSLG